MPMTISIVKANTRITRTRSARESALIRRHARQVGEIMFAWNGLHAALFSVFAAITDPDPQRTAASAAWHKLPSDHARRAELLTAANGNLAQRPDLLANLAWAVARTGDLSPRRNVAAHTPMWMGVVGVERTVFPDLISARGADVATLVQAPISSTWRALRGDLNALAAYSGLIAMQMLWPGAMPKTFPKRPKLQSLASVAL